MSHLERLEERRWQLMNSFGNGPFRDGFTQLEIYKIDRQIEALKKTGS